jgi:hypothetical protein
MTGWKIMRRGAEEVKVHLITVALFLLHFERGREFGTGGKIWSSVMVNGDLYSTMLSPSRLA